jgi:Ca-activated chloride channel family protein
MRFEHPNLLWLLLVVGPGLGLFFWWAGRARRRLVEQFIEARLLAALTAGVSPARQKFRAVCLAGAAALLVIALARPQWGFTWEEAKMHGLDIVVAIDTSKSMLAQDIAPSRLERAKLAALDLMQLAHSDRLGLVAFAGRAFLQCPLTADDTAFRQSVEMLDVNIIPQGGTSLAEAINTAFTAFKEGDNHKALVLFTDGEDLEGGALDAAKEVAKDGLKIFTVGIGTPEGDLLHYTDANGNTDYVRDENGAVVKSHLNEQLLQQIALATGGAYLRMNGAQTMDTIYNQCLAAIPKGDQNARLTKQYHEQFRWPLALAVLLLLTEMFVPDRRRAPGGRPAAGVATAVVLLLAGAGSLQASPAGALKAYNAGKFDAALKEYERLAAADKTGDARLQFDAGAAAYRATNYDAAVQHFTAVLAARDVKLQQAAYFNLGNTHFRVGQAAKDLDAMQESWETAVKAYQNAVALDKGDLDASYNLALVKNYVDEIIQLRELARRAKEAADDATRRANYHRAMEIMEQLIQTNPTAKQFQDFAKRLKDIDAITTPNTPAQP